MSYINDIVFDEGLQVISDSANTLVLTSAEPSNYAAVAGLTLGTKAAPTISAPQDGASNGRRVVVSAISDGEVTASGTATHWCLLDTAGSRLLTSKALSASQVVTAGNAFSLGALSITIPDAV